MEPSPSGRPARQWLQLPARDVAAATVEGVSRVLTRGGDASVLLLAEQAGAAQMVRAVEQLAAARRENAARSAAKGGHTAPVAVAVRCRVTDAEQLRALAAAGATAVEWQVASPLLALLDPEDAGGLRAALAAAADAKLGVRLRWSVSRHDAATLGRASEAAEALRLLREQGLAPAQVDLLVVPDTRPEAAARLDVVAKHWPRRQRGTTQVLQGLTLHRSTRWPACLQGDSDELDPGGSQERSGDATGWQAPCDGCPSRGPCAGFPAALWRVLQTEGAHWPGHRAASPQPALQAVLAASEVGFSADAVELRGLRLGLRRAWRLSLPQRSIPSWQAALEGLGLTLRASAEPVHFGAGGRMSSGEGAEHLVLVSADAALAEACLRRELDALQVVLPNEKTADAGAQVQASLLEMLETHRFVGAAYGYPACCVEAFCDAFLEVVRQPRRGDNAVALLRAAWRTRLFHPELDVLSMRQGGPGRSPLRHLPCRFDCPASLALARRLLADRGGPQVGLPLPRAVLVLADGSLLSLETTRPGSVARNHMGSIDVATPAAHQPQFERELATLASQLVGQELRLVEDAGQQRKIQTRRGRERWQSVALPRPDGPLAEHFPLLLPFGAEGLHPELGAS